MAAVSEQTRVNFNPEWMGSTYSATAKLPPGSGSGGGGQLATSPPFGGSSSSGGNNNMNVYCGGSAANNADGNILAPPKLAKNRYGREEMLALFTGSATVAPPELKPTFPEFFIEQHQEPICTLPFTDIEERLLIQGGINSSKVINVVNHAERMRWNQGPPRSFGRGAGPDAPGGQSPETIQQPAPPFVAPRGAGFGGIGRGAPGPRGPYAPPGGFDQMTRPPGRFGMTGRGRGDGGRGRGFDRYGGPPGGFGGPAPFNQGGVRFSEGTAPGPQNEEDWTPQNTRAQGLYDPNDPRDRPRQRQKSTSRDDMEDPANPSYPPAGQIRNAVSQRRSYTAPIGQAVPEWAMDDEEDLDEHSVGTFDATGQFQEAPGGTQPASQDSTNAAKKKPTSETTSDPKSAESVTPASSEASVKSVTAASTTSKSQDIAVPADKGQKVVGRSIPVDALFSGGQPTPKVEPAPVVAPPATGQQQQAFRDGQSSGANQQGRRLPKAFAGVGQQESNKLDVISTASSASPDSSRASLDISKLLGQPQPAAQFGVQKSQASRSEQQQQPNIQGQPKFVVPKTISSSTDEVFTQLHEDVESLVNSFSADDPPSVVRNKKINNETIPQQPQAPFRIASTGQVNVAAQKMPPARSISSTATPQLERSESVNKNRNLIGQQWYYTDPQGGLRGPFESKQMAAWFAAGYFRLDLQVRRAEDTDFVPLGDLIKRCGRIPFMTSTPSSTADTPSPNPIASAVAALGLGNEQAASTVVQPAARYGVAAPMAPSQNVPSNVLGALTNHTGGGAFHKTTSAHALSTPSSASTGGLWDMDFTAADLGAKTEPVSADIQAQLTILNQMLQKEREEELKRRADEEERQRKMAEAKEAARREEERLKAERQLKEKEEELRRMQEAKVEAERRRKAAEEEEARRLQEKKMLEEQQRRLEELAKKEIEERRKRAAEEERLRKEREAKEAERKRREEEEKKVAAAAAAALKQQEEERVRQEQKRKQHQQQQKKAAAAPWAGQVQPVQQPKNGAKDSSQSLMEIQKEEERQMLAERRHEAEIEATRRQNMPAANLQFGSAWGGSAAASKLKWDQYQQQQQQQPMKQSGGKGGAAWGGKSEMQAVAGGLWDDDDDSPPASPQKTKPPPQKSNQGGKANAKTQAKSSPPPMVISAKKEQNVKRIFQSQQSETDDFTGWCVKQVNGLSPDIDALTFVSFLKEVEAPAEVEDYVLSYFGDCGPARHFTKQFLEKRNGLRKAAAAARNKEDDLCTPAPALNPVKTSTSGGGENVAPAQEKASGGGGGGASKKKKSGKSAGRFVVDGSILGFKATADPNRLNAGEIDNPM